MKPAMPLPPSIRVKLSSEAAEAIAFTPVVVQDLPTAELIERMLAVAGKDPARIRELLARGTLVSGASRFRWQGFDADEESIAAMLAGFPDPEPSRAFAPLQCGRAILRGGRADIEIPRDAAARKRLFRRTCFWDALMEIAARANYGGYSYRDRADRYVMRVGTEEVRRLREAADLLAYSSLRDRIRAEAFDAVELYVPR